MSPTDAQVHFEIGILAAEVSRAMDAVDLAYAYGEAMSITANQHAGIVLSQLLVQLNDPILALRKVRAALAEMSK